MPEISINYLAVVGATAASMVLGFLWYGPLFGKQWMVLMGMTKEKIAKTKSSDMSKTYILAAVGSLVMSYVLAHSLVFASAYMQVNGISAGISTGFWNWLGFIAPVTLGSVLWEGKSWSLWILNNGYYLVSLVVMGSIIAAWPM